ncbi:MAG: triose-phosphate isomerase [Geminicoccaceae bacterium]
MPLARPVVLGNWKMNGLRADGLALAGRLDLRAAHASGTLGIFPPATLVAAVAQRLARSRILVGGQDCHAAESGAFTGSISAGMLADAGARAVIVGHSERRHGLGETDAGIKAKGEAALAAGLLVVLCIGETEAEYLAGERHAVLVRQLDGSLPAGATAENLVVAYEPVWAIGTGRTPSLEEIARTHGELRGLLAERLAGGADVALLYGGSVKPDNAADIMAIEAVDGALVGGASLDADSFWSIYAAGGGT